MRLGSLSAASKNCRTALALLPTGKRHHLSQAGSNGSVRQVGICMTTLHESFLISIAIVVLPNCTFVKSCKLNDISEKYKYVMKTYHDITNFVPNFSVFAARIRGT